MHSANKPTKSDPPRPKSKQKRTVHYQKNTFKDLCTITNQNEGNQQAEMFKMEKPNSELSYFAWLYSTLVIPTWKRSEIHLTRSILQLKKKKSRDHEKKTALYRALYWHIFTASLQMTLTWLATLEQCFGVISRMTNGVIQVTEQWNQVLGEKQFRLNLNKESWSGCNNIGESRFRSN